MKETLPHTIDKLFWNIAVNDDENAFKTLFFQFFSPLCIFAHRYIERWETCEDVVQESFLKIWENRKSIRIETSARNFLAEVENCVMDEDLKKRFIAVSVQYGFPFATEQFTEEETNVPVVRIRDIREKL